MSYWHGGCKAKRFKCRSGVADNALMGRLLKVFLAWALRHLVLLAIIMGFLVAGWWRKVPVYESFVDGAKEGFDVARKLLPYLVAMLCAVGLLRSSGAIS